MTADNTVAAAARVTNKTNKQNSAEDTGEYFDISLNDILEILTDFSVEELETLERNVQVAKATVEKRKRAEAVEAAEKAVQAFGLSLGDILAPKETGTKKVKLPGVPKYANPADKTQTWTGKGRKPAWVNEHLEAGKPLEDLEI